MVGGIRACTVVAGRACAPVQRSIPGAGGQGVAFDHARVGEAAVAAGLVAEDELDVAEKALDRSRRKKRSERFHGQGPVAVDRTGVQVFQAPLERIVEPFVEPFGFGIKNVGDVVPNWLEARVGCGVVGTRDKADVEICPYGKRL